MAKQLNVNLAFTADTGKAKAQLQDLQRQLTDIVNQSSKGSGLGINKDIEEAVKSAAELQVHLNKAINTNTGNLDFSKLSESLHKSGKNLEDYGKQLRDLGPAGQKAFQALATSVANAEIPIRRSNAALTEMWTTLKNTARWQLSSSVLHGFMGAVSTAYGYAQDLNKSLNDIRIVTGQNIDQMADFAEQANKAAKALSTTTTSYTNASLIYYQQGLSDEEVKARTDLTIKMANASGQSAEVVSDQLTAIWNNFSKGADDLEHFADVLTKLGAETASSSEEISIGLEKFAAIGDTIGLSYDNAAAALATVTATTRQSAEVVGTAFKTIFARIQGLNLGETLDDGTSLNKYSEALSKVGISIFDTTGNIKDMNTILDEMGAKWKTISKDQQIALAQTVAGVRQYNQLVALMDNFDFYEQNLLSAQNADGSLQAQADIYAESWEAAQKRVKAASQAIYQDLLNDETFIDILDSIEKILTGVDKLIDSVGGLGGVLTSIGAIATKVFHNQMAQSLTDVAYSMKMMTASGREEIKNKKLKYIDEASKYTQLKEYSPEDEKARATVLKHQLELQHELIENAERMSEIELETNKKLLDRQKILGDLKVKAAEELELKEQKSSETTFDSRVALIKKDQKNYNSNWKIPLDTQIEKTQQKFIKLQDELNKEITLKTSLPAELKKMKEAGVPVSEILKKIKDSANQIDNKGLKGFANALSKTALEGEEFDKTLMKLMASIDDSFDNTVALIRDLGLTDAQTQQLVDSMWDRIEAQLKLNEISEEEAQRQKETLNILKNSKGAQKDWTDDLVSTANATMSLISAFQILGSTWETISNPNTSDWEKLQSILMGLSSAIPMLSMALSKQNRQAILNTATSLSQALGLKTLTSATIAATGATAGLGAALITVAVPLVAIIGLFGSFYLVAKAFYNGINASNIALEQSQKELQSTNEILNDTKQKYEEICNAINKYEESVDSLSKITKGTEEWNKAVTSLNEEVIELINNYSGLSKFVTNEDGLLKISNEGLDWLENEQFNKVKSAQINTYNAQIRTNNNKAELERVNFERNANPNILNGNLDAVFELIKEHGNAIFADTEEGSAQDKLTSLLYGDSNEFGIPIESYNDLDDSLKLVIDAYIENSDEIIKLNSTLETNNQSNKILREQIANSALSNKAEYKGANQDTKSAVDKVVGQAINKAENIGQYWWSDSYTKNGVTMNDAQVQQDYAKLMGWETTKIKDKFNGSGEYFFEDGTSKVVSDETARYALNQQKKLEELTEGDFSTTAISDFNVLSKEALNVDNMQEYLEYRKKYYEIAQDTYNLEEDQVEQLLLESETVGELAKEFDLASEMALKFNNDANPSDEYYNNMSKVLQSLDEEQLDIASKVLLDSSSLEEFQIKFEQACTEAMINSWNVSAETMKTVMEEGAKEGKFSKENFETLKADEGFMNSLEQQGIDFKEFLLKNFDEQYAIVLKYYQDVAEASAQSYEIQKSFLLKEKIEKEEQLMALKQAQEEYNRLLSEGKEDQAKDLANNFKDEFGIDVTIDIGEIETELDLVTDKLDELDDKHIQVAIDWDGIAEIENGIKQTAEFAKLLKDDSKKVGDSYQLTAAQARQWMEVYPELFNEASITTDGLISLDEKYVKDFIDGKEEMSDASIQQKIDDLDAEAARLIGEKESLQKEFDAVKAAKEGEMKLEQLSGEQISDLRTRLAKYYIDLGYDEAEANAKALEDMGIDQQTYSDMVADVARVNAENQVESAEQGATAQASAISQLVQKYQEFVNRLKQVHAAVKAALSGEDITQAVESVSSQISIETKEFKGSDLTKSFTGTDKTDITAQLDTTSFDSTLEGIDIDMAEIDKALQSIENQKLYLKALQDQDLRDLGSTDPDYVDGTKGNKGSKDIKELEKYTERYHEINQEIKMYERLLDEISKAKDRAFGANKISLIEKEAEAVKNLKNKQAELLNAQEYYLAIDRAKVSTLFEDAEFDEYGNINNYTDLMENITEDLNNAQTTFNNSSQTDADKQTLENAEKLYKEKIKILETYEGTLEAYKEQEQILQDLENQLQDLNYEKLTYKLELEMIVNDNEMRELDYYFGKMEGDIEKAAEAFGILQDKLDTTSEKLFDYEDHFNNLEQAYAAGQISQADYIAGLQECYDALYDNIEALNDLDKQMMEYYGETYDLALEKIEEYTSQMEHLSGVLDHYKSIMSLLGKENNLKEMGKIIDAQVKVAEDSYKSSKSIYEMAKQQKEDAYAELMNAENDAERELLQKNYDKALEEFNNAQETMLSDAETYGELIKEALVNSMNQAAEEMEKALTGVWGSFENLQEQMGLHSTHQEEFLTNTNKLYETNKLLNQVAQDMEKTDNRASKAKYAAFAKEIEQLQEKDKLSNLELEIAQAKYNLLQAQIALEEAQNAKSMVRLTRDEEGNYGYVYTADKDKVNQAEQDLADAENDLYNIRLNATNEYAEKIIQARADMLDKLKELDERAAEDEEYRLNQYENDKANIQKAYYDLIDDYSRLHTIAQEEDVRVQQDAWTNFYSDVINQGEDWKNAITDYNNKIILSFEEWEAKSDVLTEAIEEDITDITDASENLKDTLVEDVIPAMADTLDEVRTLTAEYALQREGVLDLADAYGVLADNMEEVIRKEAQKAKNDNNNKLENIDTTKNPNAQLQETRPVDAGPGNSSSSSSSSSSGGDGILNVGDEVTFTGGIYYNDSEGGGPTGSRGPGKKVRVDRIKQGANYPIHVVSGDSAFGWLREDQLSGFNSGGYTGEWGAEGKLALLHEKELVLNPVDTENLLASISIIRELTKAIDLNATWASMGIGSLSAVGVNENSNILEQKVEIRAEFPNATDHNEIEEAFNTLINRASQYANRF